MKTIQSLQITPILYQIEHKTRLTHSAVLFILYSRFSCIEHSCTLHSHQFEQMADVHCCCGAKGLPTFTEDDIQVSS